MEIEFRGKRVLVTGAGAGIGRGICLKLVECGATVVALSKTAENLQSLKAECPSIETVCVDLSDWDVTREAVKKLTPIHCLVNNAGRGGTVPFLEVTKEQVDKMFDVNIKAVLNVSQIIAKDMVDRGEGGTIVNVSSQASKIAFLNHTVYCASKSAVDSLTRVMALELGPHQIRVNCVNPTVIMTAMGKLSWSDPAKSKPMLARIPQGKFGEVEDVVNSVLFLLSDKSDMVTAATLPIDGGATCC